MNSKSFSSDVGPSDGLLDGLLDGLSEGLVDGLAEVGLSDGLVDGGQSNPSLCDPTNISVISTFG